MYIIFHSPLKRIWLESDKIPLLYLLDWSVFTSTQVPKTCFDNSDNISQIYNYLKPFLVLLIIEQINIHFIRVEFVICYWCKDIWSKYTNLDARGICNTDMYIGNQLRILNVSKICSNNILVYVYCLECCYHCTWIHSIPSSDKLSWEMLANFNYPKMCVPSEKRMKTLLYNEALRT